jgi:hypothetical protein
MSKFFDVPVRRAKMATLAIGTGLNADANTRVDMQSWDGWRSPQPGKKGMLLAFELKFTGDFTTANGDAALRSLFLQYMLDVATLKGPGGIEIMRGSKGWHRYLYAYLNKGEIRGLRPRNIAANASGALGHNTRTVTMYIDFVEHRARNPYFRCWPVECFASKSGGAEFVIYQKSAAQALFTGGSTVHLGVPTGTLEIWAHIWDVDAKRVMIPAIVLESSQAGDTRLNPTPGAGAYLRLMMAASPNVADNDGTYADDLSAYATLNSFGYQNRYLVQNDEGLDLYMQKVSEEVSEEQHSQLDDPTQNKAEYMLFNPSENFDGHVRAIPFVYLKNGQDITDAPIFTDDPKLRANGDSRTGLPASVTWLTQTLQRRTADMLRAIVSSMTSVRGTTISAASVTPLVDGRGVPVYRGADQQLVPVQIDAR